MADQKNQILELTKEVSLLKGKVEQMDKNISCQFSSLEVRLSEFHNSLREMIRDLEVRLNTQENEAAQTKGKVAGIAFAVSLFVSLLSILISAIKNNFR